MSDFPFSPYNRDPNSRRICFFIGVMIIIALAIGTLFLDGCAICPPIGGYEFTIQGYANSPTGRYLIVEADPATVQHMFLHYGGNPRITVEGCTIWTKGGVRQIWYCTQNGLDAELYNIRSPRRLIEAHYNDDRMWLNDLPPDIGRIR